LGGIVTSANEFCRDGGTAIVAFARRAGTAAHVLPKPSKPTRQAPNYHLNNVNAYHGRLKEWLRHFHGVATKPLPNRSRPSPHAGGNGKQCNIGQNDPRRYRIETLSTNHAVRAKRSGHFFQVQSGCQ
jgi:hypothetical protein